MLSKIAGLMKGEMSRAAGMFQSAQSRFVSLMGALKEKLPPEAASEPATEPEAPPAEAAAATDVTDDQSTDAAAPAEGEE